MNIKRECEKVPDPICPPLTIPKDLFSCPNKSIWDPKNYKCVCNSPN